MGYGIRVPGVRISTRGVRIGPRFANVGVSTRGRVSGSVGPRIARVSASPRGVRFGTGLGPVRVSGGRGGVRVGGGVGPVFGSVGRGGVVVGAGLGPVWAAKGVGGRSGGRSGGSAGRDRMNLSRDYQRYKDELTQSGSSRRTRDELRIAAVNAMLAMFDYMVAPFEDFTEPAPAKIADDDLTRWAKNRAVQSLIDAGSIKAPLKTIPTVPSLADTRTAVLEDFARDGKMRPVHPTSLLGINAERLPTDEELSTWAMSEARKASTVMQRIFKGSAIRQEADRLAAEKSAEIPRAIDAWARALQQFNDSVDEVCKTRIDFAIKSRQKLIDDQKPLQDLIDAEFAKIRQAQQEVLDLIAETHRQFVAGDTTLTTIILQTVMSDNAGSAAPLGIDEGDLLVVMTAPSIKEVIWPEKIERKANLTVSKKKKDELNTDYTVYLLSHAAATAREAFATSKAIKQVRVMILDENVEKDLFQRRLVAILDASRAEFKFFPNNGLSGEWAKAGIGVMTHWQQTLASGDPYAVLQAVDWFESGGIDAARNFLLSILNFLGPLSERFTTHLDVSPSKRPKLIDLTESTVNTSDEIQVVVSEESDIMKSLDLSIEQVSSPDFWVLCQLLAEQWDQEEVDVEELKTTASEIAAVLYPLESDDIIWPS